MAYVNRMTGPLLAKNACFVFRRTTSRPPGSSPLLPLLPSVSMGSQSEISGRQPIASTIVVVPDGLFLVLFFLRLRVRKRPTRFGD